MMKTPTLPINIFYAWSHHEKDAKFLLGIKSHLGDLSKAGDIREWDSYRISPGINQIKEICKQLEIAHIILPLLSTDFTVSDLYDIIQQETMKHHANNKARVIPILLRPIDWKTGAYGKLSPLPTDHRPITGWRPYDEAYVNITENIKKHVYQLITIYWLNVLYAKNIHLTKADYNKALKAFDQALTRDASNVLARCGKGKAFLELEKYGEALDAFDDAIWLNPKMALAYYGKGQVLKELKNYEEALEALNEAIRLDSNKAEYFRYQGSLLKSLGRPVEAVEAYEHALSVNPNDSIAHYNKGHLLLTLKHYIEALSSFKHVIRLNSKHVKAYEYKGYILRKLKRYREALTVFDQVLQLDPQNSNAFKQKAEVLTKLRDYYDALIAIKDLLSLSPEEVGGYTLEGQIFFKLNCFDSAISSYSSARALDPYNMTIIAMIIMLHTIKGTLSISRSVSEVLRRLFSSRQ